MNVTIGGIARTVEITSFDKLGDVKVCMLTTTADGSVGFQQLNQEVIDTIYASFPLDTAKGSIASFEDGADDVPVRELKLNLEPYQNLNGYDHPWVGGAGVNKYNSKGLNTYSSNGITVTESNGTLTLNGTATANAYFSLSGLGLPHGNYVLSINNASATSNVHSAFQNLSGLYFGDNPLATANKVVYVNDASNHDINRVLIYVISGTTLSNFTIKPQLEVGTTATAWTPYENICPIYPANGKNLIPPNLTFREGYIRGDDGTETASSYSHYSQAIAVSPSTTYTISNITSATTAARIYFLQSDGTWISRSTSYNALTPITFDTPSNCGQIQIQCGNGIDMTKVQLEVGKYATPYVPYNAIGITRTGKNLFSVPYENGTISTQGVPITDTTYYRVCFVKVEQGTYTLSWTGTSSGANFRYFLYDEDGNFLRMVEVTGTDVRQTVTITDASYISFRWLITTNLTDLQFEEGSFTSYEPYQGERYYPISDNPVYGGTLEVETGLLTVTHKGVDLGSLTYMGDSTVPRFYTTQLVQEIKYPPNNSRVSGSISSLYREVTFEELYATHKEEGTMAVGSTGTLSIIDRRYPVSDANAYKTAVTGQMFVYPLASPLTYQLTPVQVKTLLGYNNIWTDSGTVEVQYLANIGLYIQKIIGATEDDMVANQNISANKYFFVGETLYYSTSAISAGQTIVVGTNCIKTNLADALNALNS